MTCARRPGLRSEWDQGWPSRVPVAERGVPGARLGAIDVPTPPPPPASADAGGLVSPRTVLVVDDNEVAVRVCKRVLEKQGHTVLTARDALQAVSLALAKSPDVVLLDHAMPGMDSLVALRRIKGLRPDIAIVITSVLSTVTDRERYLAAGADDVLIMPCKLTDLIKMVATITAKPGLRANDLSGTMRDPLDNQRALASVEAVLDDFVQTSFTAIEKHDPTIAGHSARVARLIVRFADAVNDAAVANQSGLSLTSEQAKELRYASLLHDVGLLGVPSHIRLKTKKLLPIELESIHARFNFIELWLRMQFANEKFQVIEQDGPRSPGLSASERGLSQQLEMYRSYLSRIVAANESSPLSDEAIASLRSLIRHSYEDMSGVRRPLLSEEEFRHLSRKGTLDENELLELQSHPKYSFDFLSRIPWPPALANVPEIAYGHHEKLDGSGYPRGLRGDQISMQTRMLVIAGMFDAITAPDRPYVRPAPLDTALVFLNTQADDGKLDKELVDIFVTRQVYTMPATAPESSWRLSALALAEDRQPTQVEEIRRQGSAHEEHVANGRAWCAICGWLDAITSPTDTHILYHSGYYRHAAAPRSRTDARDRPRSRSAHQEHVTNGRRWCAVCGWLDEITVPTAFAELYHSDFKKPN